MNRLRRPQRCSVYLVGSLLLITGAAWAMLHYLPGRFGADERNAIAVNAALMKVHGAAAMLSLLLLGALLGQHVGAGWRSARNKLSGVTILTLAALLVVTGYLLYYAGAEETRRIASHLHLAFGAGLPIVVCVHALRLIRMRRDRAARMRAWRRSRPRTTASAPVLGSTK